MIALEKTSRHRSASKARPAPKKAAAKTPSMTDRAHAAIRHDIITCKLPPGLEVSEQEFAHRLAISKTPVREALARLALEGLVETYPRRGYRITPVAVRDINDLFTVRGALEGVATELAAQTMDDDEIDALEALAQANYTPGEATSVEAFVAANLEFHSAIARGSGVTRLANMVIAHLEEATRLFYMGVNVRDVNPETSQDHRQIIALMKQRAGEEARRAMLHHNENTRRGLLASLVSDRQSNLQL